MDDDKWHVPLRSNAKNQWRPPQKINDANQWRPPQKFNDPAQKQKNFEPKERYHAWVFHIAFQLYAEIGVTIHRNAWLRHIKRCQIYYKLPIEDVLRRLQYFVKKKATIERDAVILSITPEEVKEVRRVLEHEDPDYPPYMELPDTWHPPPQTKFTVIPNKGTWQPIAEKVEEIMPRFIALDMEYNAFRFNNVDRSKSSKGARGGDLLIIGFYEDVPDGERIPHIYLWQRPRKRHLKEFYEKILHKYNKKEKPIEFVVYGNGEGDAGVDKLPEGMLLKDTQPKLNGKPLSLGHAGHSVTGKILEKSLSCYFWGELDVYPDEVKRYCAGDVIIPLLIAYATDRITFKKYCGPVAGPSRAGPSGGGYSGGGYSGGGYSDGGPSRAGPSRAGPFGGGYSGGSYSGGSYSGGSYSRGAPSDADSTVNFNGINFRGFEIDSVDLEEYTGGGRESE